MVLFTLLALAVLSSLALFDALQAWRAAALAEDALRARAAAHTALPEVFAPPSLAWLCLQPPHLRIEREVTSASGGRVRIAWRTLGPADQRAVVTGFGRHGARHRLLVRLTPDSLPGDPWVPGCPTATRLDPAGPDWWSRHPEG
jgi:hypothetical protein